MGVRARSAPIVGACVGKCLSDGLDWGVAGVAICDKVDFSCLRGCCRSARARHRDYAVAVSAFRAADMSREALRRGNLTGPLGLFKKALAAAARSGQRAG